MRSPPVIKVQVAPDEHGRHAWHKVIPLAMTHSMAFPFFCIECEVPYAVLLRLPEGARPGDDFEVWKVVHKVESLCPRCKEHRVPHFEECQPGYCEACQEECSG